MLILFKSIIKINGNEIFKIFWLLNLLLIISCFTFLFDQWSGQKAFLGLVHLIKVHNVNNGNLVTAADVLEVVRSFCSDINVATHSKTILLQLLNKNIDLSSEDMHLLMYFQSDAIIAPKWHIKVCS